MIHPSELLRTNSIQGRQFAAPANIVKEDAVDCGLTNLPCLNRCIDLEKFAKLKVFVIFLSLVGFFHGLTLEYFRQTSVIWAKHYYISQENVEWLIYTNEFFIGFVALLVAFWGNAIHRASWIGGLTIFHSLNCLVLMVPEIYRRNGREDPASHNPDNLCIVSPQTKSVEEQELNYIALAILALFQVLYAMASTSFLCHGITYLDDNASRKYGPICIGIVLAARELGVQSGLYFAGLPLYYEKVVVFISPVWITVAILTFLLGTLISMFPRNLPSVVMERASASILNMASGQRIKKKKMAADGFFKTLWRLLKNRVLMLNVFSVVLLQSAIINFAIYEKVFYQSRFYISYTNDSWTQWMLTLLKQPLVAISMIATGLVIARVKPQARSLVKYNIIISIVVIALFASTAYLKCENNIITTSHDGLLITDYCNLNCDDHCRTSSFQPICVNNKTFFSPCFAGCSEVDKNNNNLIYQNCKCGYAWDEISDLPGTDGSCNASNCQLLWILFEANKIFMTAFLSTTFITNLMINMRCIFQGDKAMALGIEATLLGLVPYVPVKIIYGLIAEQFCKLRTKGNCRFYSEGFSIFLSSSTIGLMSLSAALAVIVLLSIKFKYEVTELDKDDNGEEMQEVAPESRNLMSADNGIRNNELSHESLLDLENVGDDHDSVGSIGSEIQRRR